MLVAANALKLDFYSAANDLPSATGSSTERWDMTARQRSDPPHAYNHVLLSSLTPGEAVAPADGANLSTGPFLPRHDWDGEADDARTRFALLALTNPKEGMEEEFERWYWDRHFPDGRRLPGCFAGRRYLRAPDGLGDFHHLAVYLFDIADIGVMLDVLKRIIRTPEMPTSPAISPIVEDWYVQRHR